MHWSQLPQSGDVPGPRSSQCLVAISSTSMYLFGGEVQPRVPVSNDIYMYDVSSGAWSKLQTNGEAPCARIAATACAVGTDIYVFGGRTGIEMGSGSLNDLWRFDTVTCTWSPVTVTPGSAPPERSYHTMASQADRLYVFGGCGASGRLNDLHCFDTKAGAWQQLPTSETIAPRGGSSLTASPDGRHLYVIAGFCGKELNDVHRFDLAAGQWECATGACASCSPEDAAGSTPPGLTARSVLGVAGHACSAGCGHAGHLLAFGGEIDPSDKGHEGAGQFSGETFCYDVAGGSGGSVQQGCGGHGHGAHSRGWCKLAPGGEGPGPRGWFATATLPDGSMVVHGGINDGNDRLADMYRLDMHA